MDREPNRASVAESAVSAWVQTRIVLRIVVILLAVAAFLWILYKLTTVLLLLVLSIFFAYLIAPLVDLMQQPLRLRQKEYRIPRGLAIGIVYMIVFVGGGIALYLLLPQLAAQFPEFKQQAVAYYKTITGYGDRLSQYSKEHRMPEGITTALNNTVLGLIARGGEMATAAFEHVLGWIIFLPWIVLIPILSFFLLKDADSFRRSALAMLPRGRLRWRGDEFFQDVNSTLAAYIRAQLTACLLVGILCSIGFALIGLPSPLVLGLLAGMLEFVPLVGPLVVAILVAVLAMLHSGLGMAVVVLLFLGVLRIVQDYVIYPRIIGQGIHLHPLAVILAILAGAEIAGVAGIFLAIPVIAILTVSYRHWLEHRGSETIAEVIEEAVVESEIEAELSSMHPTATTTAEEMAQARPDLLTGELKLPNAD
ncbi:MAG TPA: AI-2E family transporter [Pyrinomonadaceae bacterium]|jgi:predicted PurR-regulated permease PerM|nr:AI-2E family transporter [Pyrinomonadaceae bacterium]